MKKFTTWFTRALITLVIVAVLVGAIGTYYLKNYIPNTVAPKSFPQIEGEINLPGLNGPVDVYRDSAGIPHIYATTDHDLIFAQGYIHAQDRFWQMDFWRHQGTGTLSEMMGAATLSTDKFLRTLGWARISEEEYATMSPDNQAILQAYADGINSYLADHKGTALSLEYTFLPILNKDYEPAPWEPIHTIAWGKAMAWDLGKSKLNGEIDYAKLIKDLPKEKIDFIFPEYPADHPYIIPDYKAENFGVSKNLKETNPSSTFSADLLAALYPAFQQAGDQVALLGGDDFEEIGSNNWVIGGELTSTGMPFLANDMHLGVQMPSIWYLNGLHCVQINDNCKLDVVGFSFAGVPMIIGGHNAHQAWGFTNVGPDIADLYIEKINPDNPNQYEFQGEWVDMQLVNEIVNVAGDDPVELNVQITRHGPIITETYGLEDFHETTGVDLPENYALSLRWTALDITCAICAFLDFNYAQTWEEFRAAAAQLSAPSQNLVFADIDGNIGYQTPGIIPIRDEGHNGLFPVPGWTGEFEWQGYIPFEELPTSYNPSSGYITTANNAIVSSDYPYMINQTFAYGFRAQRIVEMIENAPGPIDAAYIQQIHADSTDLLARELVPVLMKIPLDGELATYRDIFKSWDFQMNIDSAPALLYAAFWKHLMAETYQDDLPEFYWPDGGQRWMEVTRILLNDSANAWWDDHSTTKVETRDDIILRAFEDAVDEIKHIAGKDPANWAWGDVHGTTFKNQVMNNLPFIKDIFNRGPFPTAGGSSIVNANAWSSIDGYEVNWLVSERLIMDLSDWDRSIWINTTGQSGHAYHPHYIDMADSWRLVKYVPQYWQRSSIEADVEGHLRLVP